MSESQTQELSTIKPGRIFALVLFVAMAAAIAYLYGSQKPSAKQAEETGAMKAELENANELILQLKEAELHRRRDQHVAESRLAGARTRLETTSSTVAKLEKAIQKWNDATSDLMTNTDGVRLAASPAALAQAEAILQTERPSENLPATLQARLDPLAKLVNTAEKAEKEELVSFDPGPTFSAELDAISREAEPALKMYDEHNRRLAAILVGLSEASPENIQLGKDIAAALAKKKLEREFQQDLPQINSLLAPFIAHGRTQPDKGFFRQSTKVGPVSLKKLNSERLLNVSIQDQRRLWSMTAAGRNDRDLGGFPSYIGNATDWNAKQPTVQRAQALLIKYGELMVEKKMLAP